MDEVFIESNDIPKELIVNVLRGNVVPFIGAGLSIPFGYPNWRELILGIKDELMIEDLLNSDIGDVDPLQIAQALFHYFCQQKYNICEEEVLLNLGLNATQSEINNSLKILVNEQTMKKLELDFSRILLDLVVQDTSKKVQAEINKLQLLDQINFNYIITTNYDRILEDEIFKTQKFSVQSLGKNEELGWNEQEKTIIKIHGDIDSNNGIIFTHSQYYKFMNESGYFRSKIYTTFSSNVILMMGYGFNDINVHQIYFQFLRDYGKNINGCKFFMVLTEYDKDNWGTYFKFYIHFLESYKIQVLLVKDIPSFVENLYLAIDQELKSASLELLFTNPITPDFSNILVSIIKGEDCEVIQSLALNKDLIRSFIKIFQNDFIITKEPFCFKERDLTEIGLNMLDFTYKILNITPELYTSKEFEEILNIAIKFTNVTRDFYDIRNRLDRFINLTICSQDINLSDEFGLNLYETFGYCHPSRYLSSNPGGKILDDRLTEIPKFIIMKYLETIQSKNYSKEEDKVYLDSVHSYWLNRIHYIFDDDEIKTTTQEIIKKGR